MTRATPSHSPTPRRPWRRRLPMERLAPVLPLGLAVLFGVYAYGLILNNLDTYASLKAAETARIVDDTRRSAATIGDYLNEQRRFLAELAQSPEITNYLVNKALGMSLRYGLRANLDAIDTKLARTISTRRIGAAPLYVPASCCSIRTPSASTIPIRPPPYTLSR